VGDLLALIERMGRAGAVLVLAFALACHGTGSWLFHHAGAEQRRRVWSPRGAIAGFAVGLLGLLLSIYGVTLLRRPARPRAPKPSADEFHRMATLTPRPFLPA